MQNRDIQSFNGGNMKFKVGDLVKIIGYKDTPKSKLIQNFEDVSFNNRKFLLKIAKIVSINMDYTWNIEVYIPKFNEKYGVSEEELELLPICRTEIYKALTEGE